MLLFQSKIDPFSSFTINLGPLYVDRVFDSLLTRQGVKDVFRMTDGERFANYLEYLRKNTNPNSHNQYAFTQFYKGHFYQRLAHHSSSNRDGQHFREKALCYYQTYLELSGLPDESQYYAQWQIGMLQDTLKYPWLLAEDALLKASALDPIRGEAIKKIIDHYILNKEWNRAHQYSAIAMHKFFNKNPIAYRRWFIDFEAYNWRVARTHRILSYRLAHLTKKSSADGTVNNQAISQ
jgi:hypothetical protein